MEKSAKTRLQIVAGHLIPSQINKIDLNHNNISASSATNLELPVIIGGMVLDIHAKPNMGQDTHPRTTVIGTVKYMSGGVARNIAECVSKLGRKPFMVSVVGSDLAGEQLLKYWHSAGLSTEGILKIPGGITPVVANTFDIKGELATGVASVEAVEKHVTPAYIQNFRQNIRSAPIILLDANLHPHSLDAASKLAAAYGVPVFFEPVSIVKSRRLKSFANNVTITSPNEDELIAMAIALTDGVEFYAMQKILSEMKKQPIDSLFTFLIPAINLLLQKGIKLLVITIGVRGSFVCFKKDSIDFIKHPLKNEKVSRYFFDKSHALPDWYSRFLTADKKNSKLDMYAFHLPSLHASVISLTGAGDCLVGGILASICNGYDIMQSVAIGNTVGKVAVEAETNVPDEFDIEEVTDKDSRSSTKCRSSKFKARTSRKAVQNGRMGR